MSKQKKIPKHRSEKAEQKFWEAHDSVDYIDWSQAKIAEFPNLKPSTKTISLRLPEHLLDDLKKLANKQDVPYQSLIKIILSQSVNAKVSASKRAE